MPFFPLGTVLFPGAPLVLHVFEERYRELVRTCLASDRRFGVVLITRGSEVGGGEEREQIGTVAIIDELHSLGEGRSLVAARGTERIRLRSWALDNPYPSGEVEPYLDNDAAGSPVDLEPATQALRRTLALAAELERGPALLSEVPDLEPTALGWWLCEQSPLSVYDRQRLLATDSLGGRLELLGRFLEELSNDVERLLRGR